MIARKSLLIVVSNVISAVLGLISFVFILRFMGLTATDALGVYGSIIFAMSFVATFTFIADLGFGMAHIKRVSEGKDLSKCLGTYATVRLTLTGVMVAVILISIAIWKTVLHGSFSYSINESVVYLFILYYVVFNISSIATTTFDARTETAKSQLSQLAEPLIRTPFIVIIGVSGLVPAHLKLYYIALAYLAGIIASLIVSMVLLRNYPFSRPDKEMFRYYLKFALPFIVISVISVVVSYADKLIIGFFWNSVSVGQYAGAQAITLNIYFISIAVGYLLFPTMSAHYTKRDITKIRALTYKAERYIAMIITPISFFIIVFAEEILQLLNGALVPAANAFRILGFAILLTSIGTPNGYQVLAFGRTDLTLKFNILQCCIFIFGCFLFVPRNILGVTLFGLGIEGAAIAYLIGVAVSLICAKYYAWKLTKTRLRSYLIIQIISACIMAIILYCINSDIYQITRWYELLFALIIGTGIYVGFLTFFKDFSKKDIDFLLDTMNPVKMKNYVTTEIKKNDKK